MTIDKQLTLSLIELLDFDYAGKNVLILGNASTGKTWLAKKICTGTHVKIAMDDFLAYGHDAYIEVVMQKASNIIGKSLIEGCGGFRLLRKGYELSIYRPDIVIHIEAPTAQMSAIYQKERDPAKIKGVLAQSKGHTSILNSYFGMVPVEERPLFIHFLNIF